MKAPDVASRPATSATYDWMMAIASLWLSGGIMVDAWHHFHSTVETFFEPAHALLYSGLLASAIFTAVTIVASTRKGYGWRSALPAGYGVTSVGLFVCLAGGLTDMVKHSLWGFEEGFNALLSPAHLLIGAGMFLIIAGPIRAALARESPENVGRPASPVVVSSLDDGTRTLGYAVRLPERSREDGRADRPCQHAACGPHVAHAAIR